MRFFAPREHDVPSAIFPEDPRDPKSFLEDFNDWLDALAHAIPPEASPPDVAVGVTDLVPMTDKVVAELTPVTPAPPDDL